MSHIETGRVNCPVCHSELLVEMSADVDISVESCRLLHENKKIVDEKDETVTPYKPDLPLVSWFDNFFLLKDESTGDEVGFTDGRVLLTHHDLPACFILDEKKVKAIPPDQVASFTRIPAAAVECRPKTVHGKLKVIMVAGDVEINQYLGRPIVDLAYFLCPEVSFFYMPKEGGFGLFYMTSPAMARWVGQDWGRGDLFMTASGMYGVVSTV